MLFLPYDFADIFRLDLLSLISLDDGILGLTIDHVSIDFGGVDWVNFDARGIYPLHVRDRSLWLFIVYIFVCWLLIYLSLSNGHKLNHNIQSIHRSRMNLIQQCNYVVSPLFLLLLSHIHPYGKHMQVSYLTLHHYNPSAAVQQCCDIGYNLSFALPYLSVSVDG